MADRPNFGPVCLLLIVFPVPRGESMQAIYAVVLSLFLLLFPTASRADGVVDIGVAHDAQVVEGYPSNNYGTQTNMYVASATGTYGNERAWLMFDLTGHLPPGAVITSATLRLYCYQADNQDDMVTAVHGSEDDAWTETTINWNTQPAIGSEASRITMTAKDEDHWFEWDVTSFVQSQWTGDTAQAVSLVVKAATESQNSWRTYIFDAREFSTSLAPRLRITYTGDWPTGNGFTILHTNDAHSRLLPHEFDVPGVDDFPVFETVGGAAYLCSRMLALKDANPDSLVLDAGDISEGSPLGDLRGNGGMVDFYNVMDAELKSLGGRGIDAVVVGNHDVRAIEMINNMKVNTTFPVISINVCHDGSQTPYFEPYTTVTINNTKIGILGYTNDESSYLGEDTDPVIDIVKCAWDDNDASTINIKDYVKTLRETEGCDVVVMLVHIGHRRLVTSDTDGSGPALIADTGGVLPPEVVISGHWHTWTETVWQPAQVNGKTLIAEAASYMQYIGELSVTGSGKYVAATKHPIRNSEITPNTAVQTLIDSLVVEYNAGSPAHQLDEVIGYSATDLTLDKDKWWTVSEYPWSATNSAGAWICDAMAWKAAQLGYAVDLAIQSGGGIRRDVPGGPVTYAQIYETYPWQDDTMVRIEMTGSQIKSFLEDKYCGASISDGWLVQADDGEISEVKYQGAAISLTGTYQVAISEYMLAHEISSYTSDTTPESIDYSIREAVVDYTGQYTEASPMTVTGPRYELNTEFAGGFRAVVTMVDDMEREPYFEAVFVRLLSATSDTLTRRNAYGLTELVQSDGSINPDHQFSETMLYRSHLGFKDGQLQPGDVLEIRGEGGFYSGNPQFVDQEGIADGDNEIRIIGHDTSVSLPVYYPGIQSFWDEWHENHYVKFYAEKTGDSTVQDVEGTEITVYQPGGYYEKLLPGETGDLLVITGVNTQRFEERRFRCHTAQLASEAGVTGYPPNSSVDAISPEEQTAASLDLTVTATDPLSPGEADQFEQIAALDTRVEEASPDDNFGNEYVLTVQSASGSNLNKRCWFRFDLSGLIPDGATVTSARLMLRPGQFSGADLDIAVHGSTDDAWTETGLTWNSQPGLEPVLDTITVNSDHLYNYQSWDVTSFVSGQISGGDPIVSLALKAATEGSSTASYVIFSSREYQSTYAPKLTIEYETGGTAAVSRIMVYYRYSQDALAWSAWTSYQQMDAEPWSLTFPYPDGYGYYEFYSIAEDADNNVEDAPENADAAARYWDGINDAPAPASDPGVPDGEYEVDQNTLLSVTVSDPDYDLVDVYFYDADTHELIGLVTGVGSGQTASVTWLNLEDDQTYRWYVVVDDGETASESAVWSFSTGSEVSAPVSVPADSILSRMIAILLILAAGIWTVQRKTDTRAGTSAG